MMSLDVKTLLNSYWSEWYGMAVVWPTLSGSRLKQKCNEKVMRMRVLSFKIIQIISPIFKH